MRAHNLNVLGKKAQLVQRLLDEVPEELTTLFRDRTYELTDSGREVLEVEAADIFVMEIHGDKEGLEGVYRKAQERFDKEHGVSRSGMVL